MQLTVRTYDAKAREHILASIKRQVEAEATAANAPKMPEVKVVGGTDAVYNDPELTSRLVSGVREMPAKMAAEDFSPCKGGQASRSAFAILGTRARADTPPIGFGRGHHAYGLARQATCGCPLAPHPPLCSSIVSTLPRTWCERRLSARIGNRKPYKHFVRIMCSLACDLCPTPPKGS